MSFFTPVNNIMPQPGYATGRTYDMWRGIAQSQAVAAVDIIYFFPFQVFYPLTFTQGILRCVTGGAASSAKCAIWTNGGTTGPNSPFGAPLFADNTGTSTVTSSTNPVIAFSGTLQPGNYWFGSKYTGTLPSMLSLNTTDMYGAWFRGNGAAAIYQGGVSIADAYANAMPTLADGAAFSVSAANIPVFGLTAA